MPLSIIYDSERMLCLASGTKHASIRSNTAPSANFAAAHSVPCDIVDEPTAKPVIALSCAAVNPKFSA